MSPGANVKRVAILHELNKSLGEFAQVLSSQMQSVQPEINKTLEWLAERERHWRNEVQRCTVELQQAERAYAACMSQPADEDGRRPSCRGEAAEVAAAQRSLAKAQAELNNLLQWRRTVDNKISAYIGQATRIQRMANTSLSQASTFLSEKARELGDYGRVQPPSTINVIGQRGQAYERAKQEMLLHALDDPLVGRDIKGWIRNEIRRMKLGQSNRIRMPGITTNNPYVPDLDAGHRIHDVHHWSNLRFEDVWLNRTRYHRAYQLGLADRFR